MGTDCVAVLFLFSFEFSIMKELIRTNVPPTFRYIDDLLTTSNPDFSDYISKIY